MTRDDILGFYREYAAETRRAMRYGELDPSEPPTVDEFVTALINAIADPPPLSPATKARMRRSQRRRRATERRTRHRHHRYQAAAA